MDFRSPILKGIPRKAIPIRYKRELSLHVLNPGPRLATDTESRSSLEEWKFPLFSYETSQKLIKLLQFSIAYIARKYREIDVWRFESLQNLQRDMARCAKSVWVQATVGNNIQVLDNALTEFFSNDARFTEVPAFHSYMNMRMERHRTDIQKLKNRIISQSDEDIKVPNDVWIARMRRSIKFAIQTLIMIVSATEEVHKVEEAVSHFKGELNEHHQGWISGRVKKRHLEQMIELLFKDSSPAVFFINVREEYSKSLFISRRKRVIHTLSPRLIGEADTKNLMSCPVCSYAFRKEDRVYTTTCAHIFHERCVTNWLWESLSCPMDGTEFNVRRNASS